MTDIIENKDQQLKLSQEVLATLKSTDWYEALTDELSSSIVETEFDVKYKTIELYHNVGRLIVENTDNFERQNVYGKHIAEVIGNDINRHPSIVRRAMQFYSKFPDLKEFLSDKPKNLSWAKIRKEYLPNFEKAILEDKPQEAQENTTQEEESSSAQISILDAYAYTTRDILDLFLYLRKTEIAINEKELSLVFINSLKRKFQNQDIENFINEYFKNKTENERKLFEELLTGVNTPSNLDDIPQSNPSLFTDFPPKQIQSIRAVQEKNLDKFEFEELLNQYKESYRGKFKHDPVISPESLKKWLKQFTTKKEQGFSVKEIITILKIFASSKDSNAENLGLNLGTFFSDTIFNKMLAIKNKNSNIVMEDKYAKF